MEWTKEEADRLEEEAKVRNAASKERLNEAIARFLIQLEAELRRDFPSASSIVN